MRLFIERLLAFFRPGPLPTVRVPAGVEPSLLVAYEQSLTTLLRIGGGLGFVAVLAVSPLLLEQGRALQLLLVAGAMLVLLLCGLFRQLAYWLRCGAYLVCFYCLAVADLIVLGFSAEVYIYLLGFALFATIYFSYRLPIGLCALALSVATLAGFGALFQSGALRPLLSLQEAAQAQLLLIRGLLFLLVVGTGQAGILALLNALKAAWRREQAAREQLEARVAERTGELASAHDRALAHSRQEAQQNEYLAALHQTTLELLSERDVAALLQAIVERACSILDSAYALILLEQNGELLVMARTEGVLAPIGERALRGRAVLTWQCYDTQQPVIVDNYGSAKVRNPQLDALQLHSVINLPIMAGSRCLGVLSWNRVAPGHSYTSVEIEHGLSFARLVAVVIENARLHAAEQRELSERQRAEGELKRYADALERQNTELDAFAHTVAHDLKSPLTSIIGYAELLINNADLFSDDEVDKFLGTIMQMGYKMTRIVNDLLMLASVRAESEVPIERLDMDLIMVDLDIRLGQAIASSQATIRRPERWPAALGYAPWVEEVLANYLTNAIKYGGEPPCVALGAELIEGDMVRFWVHDNGPGLSPEEQAQLFTPFTRLRRRRAEGHGLGLSIARRIVLRLGGTVGVESQLGQGCRFFFTLPGAPIESEGSPPHPPAPFSHRERGES